MINFVAKTISIASAEKITLRLMNETDHTEINRFDEALKQEDGFLLPQSNTSRVILIGLQDSQIIAKATIKRFSNRKQHGGTLSVGILPAYRGKGLGTILLSELLAIAKAQGIIYLTLNTYATNTPAIHLYKKAGFQQFGRLPKAVFYKNAYIDLLYLYKSLE